MPDAIGQTVAQRQDVYPSRMGGELGYVDRKDPIIHSREWRANGRAAGTQAAPLTASQAAFFEENGYVVLPDLLGKTEVADLLAELDRLREDPDVRARDETIIEPGSDEVRSIFACHWLSRKLHELVRDPRLLDVARFIAGSDVYLHQARVNYKPGFRGEPFQWHSDFETWHTEDGMPRMHAVSCAVGLTENSPHNGPLLVIRGSHKTYVRCPGKTPERNYERSLRVQEVGSPPEEALRRLFDEGGIDAAVGPPGTVVFFDCNTMHGSNSNITPQPRSNVFMVYNSVENRLEAPFGPPGQTPRPEHIAHREHADILRPLDGA